MNSEMTTEQLRTKLEEGEPLNLIDVREQEEWNEGHIKEAKFLPLSELQERLDELKGQTQPLVLICRSGNRSGKACAFLAAQGYSVVNVLGGMLAWDGPVTTGE
ncbi:rhodanese-like domain-containing protein [Paenibacillus beijingensis]|uniref:Sulfurtransferase n=1 Tax=Paenibacillus beijingensis TaxID=1126833 RepID=A0A0D5NMX9_9BACL|nr:rhodanese-like domain-containing protein [Paenibacillus beijingensis]AJY76654.1 sulfurtransferase [Paenibacillus beijingensis]